LEIALARVKERKTNAKRKESKCRVKLTAKNCLNTRFARQQQEHEKRFVLHRLKRIAAL